MIVKRLTIELNAQYNRQYFLIIYPPNLTGLSAARVSHAAYKARGKAMPLIIVRFYFKLKCLLRQGGAYLRRHFKRGSPQERGIYKIKPLPHRAVGAELSTSFGIVPILNSMVIQYPDSEKYLYGAHAQCIRYGKQREYKYFRKG